jgi:ppGpp synthetase/RelA/SpoT-type nucleotidyltranferase
MPDAFSGSQLEKLGERLRDGPLLLADLQQLTRFQETLAPFADATFDTICSLDRELSGIPRAKIIRRTLKTVRSTIAKLRRQTTTLRQIQDIVGCRIVVLGVHDQEIYAGELERLFPSAQIIDRRTMPQHGYRAMHFIVRDESRRFEIQLRTIIQDDWANLVEKVADRMGIEIKYGGGDISINKALIELSEKIGQAEALEGTVAVWTSDKSVRPPSTRLWYNGDFVSILSFTEIPQNTSFLLSISGSSKTDRIVISELWNTWKNEWGSMYNYAVEFDGGRIVQDEYESILSGEDVLSREIGYVIEFLERQYS